MTKTFKEYKADADKQNAELKKNDLGSIDNSADAAIKLAEDTYKKAEANTIADYASDYERNAVQKLINEKKVAETNANLGLTDSGLNRTQQTAVQLSYANQKGKLDLARQQALDKLSSDLASYVTGINNQREADKLSVNQFYDQQSNTIATELYNTDVEDARKRWETEYNAGVELNKAAIEASAKAPNVSYGAGGTSTGGYIVSSKTGTLSRDYMGSLKDNGVSTVYSYDEDGGIKSVTYTESNSGISATFDVGVNPYYGDMHEDLRNEDGEYDPSRAFSNGYQPNNIKGEKLFATKYDKVEVYDGSPQTVFKTKSNDKLWIWDAARNDYIDYREFMGVKDWDAGDWEGYFATVRNIDGRAAAEEELLFYSNNGLLPDDMMYFARIGAQGSFGH